MTDKELLEMAARAAGMNVLAVPWPKNPDGWFWCEHSNKGAGMFKAGATQTYWNPLTDDGDALRLAVKLGICIEPYPLYSEEKHTVIAKQRRRGDQMRESNPTECAEIYGGDPCAATRRAIVRAAAAIGGQMP